MNIFTKFDLLQCSGAEQWTPSLHILKYVLQVTKSLKRDNIHTLNLCLKHEHTCRILTSYIVSKLRYRAHAPKNETSGRPLNQPSVAIFINCVYGC